MLRKRFLFTAFGLALAVLAAPALADRGPPHRSPPPEFRSQHWVLDSRYHHDHYYPRVGYSLSILPPGYLGLTYHDRHFFFNAGVWFVQSGPNYVVTMPPAGIVIPVLPPAYTTVWIGSQPYYYANGIYYTSAPGGYATVPAPAGSAEATVAPPPPPAGPAGAPILPANDLLFIYPLQGQSEARINSDRMECTYWAIGRTGYDPDRSPADDVRRGDYLRAVSGCLESRGYRVK